MKSLIAVAFVAVATNALPEGMYGAGANLNCPVGFQLNGKNCEKPIYGMPNIRCITGSLVGNECVTKAPMSATCPIGSIPEGKGECAVVQSLAPQTRCPAGFSPAGGGCAQRTPLPLITVCDIGHSDGTQCVQVEKAQKVIRTHCPAGFHDEGSGCERLEEYDCSPPRNYGKDKPAPAPAAPLALSYGNKKHGHKRMLGAKKYNVYSAPVVASGVGAGLGAAYGAGLGAGYGAGYGAAPAAAQAMVASPPVVSPPAAAVQVVGQTCSRRDFAPPIIESSCPEGFVEQSTSCVKTSFYPMTEKCSTGAPAAACYDTKTVAPITSCAKGVLSGEVCQFKETMPMLQTCPAGAQSDGAGSCAQRTLPMATCPTGTALQGDQCVGRELAEPTGAMVVPCTGKSCFRH